MELLQFAAQHRSNLFRNFAQTRPESAVKVCPICKCSVACALLRLRLRPRVWLCCAAPALTCPIKVSCINQFRICSHKMQLNAGGGGRGQDDDEDDLVGQEVRVGIMQTFGALSTQLAGNRNRNRNRRWAAVSRKQGGVESWRKKQWGGVGDREGIGGRERGS